MSPSNGQKQLEKPEPNGTPAAVLNTAHPARPPRDHHAGRKLPPGLLEALTLVALLTAYGVFLVLGTFVNTVRLDEHFAQMKFTSGDILTMLTCWTWTNLLILCSLSSVIGELGRRLLLGARQAPQVRAALVRGFFILLLMMAGQLVILGTPAATAVPAQFIPDELSEHICLQRFFRLAAFASLVSLVVALQPDFMRLLIDRVLALLTDSHNDQPDTPTV